MPTPDIIVKFRKEFLEEIGTNVFTWRNDTWEDVESFLLQALTDREAEIVAGIEKVKGGYNCYECGSEGWDAGLDEIATKITEGEI